MKERKKKEHILCEFLHPKKEYSFLCWSFCCRRRVVAFEREEDFYCERRFALRHVHKEQKRTKEKIPQNAKMVDDDDMMISRDNQTFYLSLPRCFRRRSSIAY